MSTFLDVATPGRPEIFGTVSTNEKKGVDDATLTVAHTVDSGTQLLLVRTHAWGALTGTGFPVTSVVWDAAGVNEALGLVAKGAGGQPNRPSTEIWARLSPTAKSATITITYNHATAMNNKFAHAVNIKNVDVADPIGGTFSAGNVGTSVSGTLTTETAEPLIIAAATWEDSRTVPSWTAPLLLRYIGNSGTSANAMLYLGAEDATQTTIGNKTIAISGGANDYHTVCAVEIRGVQ